MIVFGVGASTCGTKSEEIALQPIDRGHRHHRPGRDAYRLPTLRTRRPDPGSAIRPPLSLLPIRIRCRLSRCNAGSDALLLQVGYPGPTTRGYRRSSFPQSGGGGPDPRQEFGETAVWPVIDEPGQDISEVGAGMRRQSHQRARQNQNPLSGLYHLTIAWIRSRINSCDPAWKIDPCRGVIGVQL